METKVWDMSFAQEDVEVLLGRPLSEGEWNIIVDELYNNDDLYDVIKNKVMKVVVSVLE